MGFKLKTFAKRVSFEGARAVDRAVNLMDTREVPVQELPETIEKWQKILEKSHDPVELEHIRVCLERARKL